MLILLERMTRFNSPYDKLERVYREVLFRHSIEPKIKIANFRKYSFSEICQIFSHIWNESVKSLGGGENRHFGINLYLAYEEMREFSIEEFLREIVETGVPDGAFEEAGSVPRNALSLKGFSPAEKFFLSHRMTFPPDLYGFLSTISEKTDLPKNIKRLVWINNLVVKENLHPETLGLKRKLKSIYDKTCQYRAKNECLNPIKLVILAEGLTEETLLPVFAKVAGINFAKNGIKIISSGGKNKVLRYYYKLSRETNVPILMLFDSDGIEEAESVKDSLRSIDGLHVIESGEFEDILPDSLICGAVNSYYRLAGKINLSDIAGVDKKASVLSRLWQVKGFGEFKKAEFAGLIAKHIRKKSDLSEELEVIFAKIRGML